MADRELRTRCMEEGDLRTRWANIKIEGTKPSMTNQTDKTPSHICTEQMHQIHQA